MEEITKAQGEHYLEDRGAARPVCHGNIEGGSMEFNGRKITQSISCSNCGLRYTDVYRLTAVATDDGKTVASIAIPTET